jgi:hypothetical protein
MIDPPGATLLPEGEEGEVVAPVESTLNGPSCAPTGSEISSTTDDLETTLCVLSKAGGPNFVVLA